MQGPRSQWLLAARGKPLRGAGLRAPRATAHEQGACRLCRTWVLSPHSGRSVPALDSRWAEPDNRQEDANGGERLRDAPGALRLAGPEQDAS